MPWVRTALVAVALLWAGMVLGVAMIAVPAQFAAEGLTRPQGIDITRQVFARFDRVELGLAAATLLLALLLRAGPLLWSLLALVWLIVALGAVVEDVSKPGRTGLMALLLIGAAFLLVRPRRARRA